MSYADITLGNLYNMKVNWYLAGLRFCMAAHALPVAPERLTELTLHCQDGIQACEPYLQSETPVTKDSLQEHWRKDRAEENRIFELAVAAVAGRVQPDDAIAMMKNCYIRLLNDFEWNVIEKNVSLEGMSFVSRITPMNRHYAARLGGNADPFGTYGTSGLGSMSPRLTDTPDDRRTLEENHRITNFWMTELLYGQEQMFAAFRSGSLSGKLINRSDEAINRKNAQQLLEAVALEEDYRRNYLGERFVEAGDKMIMLVSINLQTGNKLGKESSMIQGQNKALDVIAETLSGDDEIADDNELRRLQEERRRGYTIGIASFNCEVNNVGGMTPWHNNNSEDSWNRVFNKAAAYHHALRKSTYHLAEFCKMAVNELVNKLRQSKSDLLRPANDYKIASRLAALAYLSGCHVHFNCKSGKDRTGLMDIEVKRLIAAMYVSYLRSGRMGRQVVVPQYTLNSGDQNRMYQALLKDSGNFEVQEYNTGGRGFKVAHLVKVSRADKALNRRFGADGGLAFAHGLKDYMDIDNLGRDPLFTRIGSWVRRHTPGRH